LFLWASLFLVSCFYFCLSLFFCFLSFCFLCFSRAVFVFLRASELLVSELLFLEPYFLFLSLFAFILFLRELHFVFISEPYTLFWASVCLFCFLFISDLASWASYFWVSCLLLSSCFLLLLIS
jgi:hypothetical protein